MLFWLSIEFLEARKIVRDEVEKRDSLVPVKPFILIAQLVDKVRGPAQLQVRTEATSVLTSATPSV